MHYYLVLYIYSFLVYMNEILCENNFPYPPEHPRVSDPPAQVVVHRFFGNLGTLGR